MNTNDKTPPIGTIEDDLSAEEKAIHEAEAKQAATLSAERGTGTELRKLQSDASL